MNLDLDLLLYGLRFLSTFVLLDGVVSVVVLGLVETNLLLKKINNRISLFLLLLLVQKSTNHRAQRLPTSVYFEACKWSWEYVES